MKTSRARYVRALEVAMRWMWPAVFVVGAMASGCGPGADDGAGSPGNEDETSAGTPGSETTAPGTTSRGGTAGNPEPVVETHECGPPPSYTFEWNATLEVGEPAHVTTWCEYGAQYRQNLADAAGVTLDEIPASNWENGGQVLAGGHIQGTCVYLIDYNGNGEDGFICDTLTLTID